MEALYTPSDKMRRYAAYGVIFSVFAIPACLAFCFGARNLSVGSVLGRVVAVSKSEFMRIRDDNAGVSGRDGYDLRPVVTYEVAGKTYTFDAALISGSDRIRYLRSNPRQIHVGDRVRVFFDPRNPGLPPPVNFYFWLAIILGVLVAVSLMPAGCILALRVMARVDK